MANFSELAHKKVAGIPVIYLAGGFVVILAIVAYKMKPSTSSAGDGTADSDSGDASGAAPTPNPYDSIDPDGTGTVTVVQGGPSTTPDPVVQTNGTWVTDGTKWLVAEKGIAGTAASTALNKYVNGQDRTFQENQWVDDVIAKFGDAPDGKADGGTVGAKPASKQFAVPPGVHTIVGGSDNGFTGLAALYYNSTAKDRIDLLQAANTKLYLGGPWPVGTKVNIPAYHAPVYYTTTASNMTPSSVASKNGITVDQLSVLNDGTKKTYPKGTKLRVK